MMREIPPTPAVTLLYIVLGTVTFYAMYFIVNTFIFKKEKKKTGAPKEADKNDQA